MDRSEKPRRGGEDDNGGTLFRGLDPRYFETRSQNNGIHRWILNPSRTLDGDVFTLLAVKRRDGREKKVVTCKEVSRRCL